MSPPSIRIPDSFPSPADVAGRRVVVTGATRGLGRLLVEAFVAGGADVLAVARSGDDLEKLARDVDGAVAVCSADVATEEGNQAAMTAVVETFGGLDVWIANAGVSPVVAAVSALTLDEWRTIMTVNLDGVFIGCKLAAQQISDGGRIIITGSILASRPRQGLAAYAASKAGTEALAKTLAVELAPRRVTVNVVSPGWFDSPLAAGWQGNPTLTDEILGHTALARWGMSEDLPGAYVFLASRAADFITGSVLTVDGGYQCL